jgi:tRNA 2-selenouridine synthase
MDGAKRIWLEDESRKIGLVYIQDHLWFQMRDAPMIQIDLPLSERLDFLVQEYGKFPIQDLADSILKIGKRLGGQNVKACMECLESGDLHKVAEITLNYYDQSYAYGQSSRDKARISKVHFDTLEPEMIAKTIVDFNEK